LAETAVFGSSPQMGCWLVEAKVQPIAGKTDDFLSY